MPRLGLRFEHWPAGGETWYHVHGDNGAPAGGNAFHQLWARARRAGQADLYHRYAAAGVLAETGKFVHPQGEPGALLASFDYALRLDPDRYRRILASLADQLRVARTQGDFAGVEPRDDGGVAALLVGDGRRIEADLHIDASGSIAMLARAVGGAFEDWSGALPYDRLLLGEGPPSAATPNDTVIGGARGWRFASPLPGRTVLGQVYASTDPAHDGRAITLRPGRLANPWIRNVLAIGDAAVALDPLHWPNLHLAQSGIARALELLPGRDCHPVEIAEYNRRAREEARRMRDFQALHYLRAGAPIEIPESLARTLQQFESRGRLPSYDEDSLPDEIWLSALLGLGVLPRDIQPLAAGLDADTAAARMTEMHAGLGQLPARMPSFADYLAGVAEPPRQGRI
jgi:tryptophan halogenase